MALLEVKELVKLESGNPIVDRISFRQEMFQKIAIAGETGSGKTTLLKLIAGLTQPDSGETRILGERVTGPDEKLLPGHRFIAFLSQHFELRNNYLVEEELNCKNLLPSSEAERIYRVCRIDHLLKRRTDQLSGGERQRIVLARLLITSPKLLLLDEPFSNLDAIHKNVIQSVIKDVGDELGITCIMVSHDAPDLLSWADLVFLVKDGRIVQRGAPMDVYYKPVDEYCAGLLGEYNFLDAEKFITGSGIDNGLSNGKTLFLRPGQVFITERETGTINGYVQACLFKGSYYSIEVFAGDQLIRLNSMQPVQPGQKVSLAFDKNERWHL